jgi:hypothetical protein
VKDARGRHVCSVAAADVRPFWGRAAAIYLGSVAAAAVLGVLAVFAGFRAIGYRVSLASVAWPPAWHRVQLARADYYYRMALGAFEAGDVRKCFLALSQVYVLDPDNVGASRLLAQFTQIANPEYSDAIYSRLLGARRGDFEETAEAWFRALLARGDFASAGHLCSVMLREHGAHVPAWTEGLVFSSEMTGDPAEMDRLLDSKRRIPDEALSVLELVRSCRTDGEGGSVARTEIALGGSSTSFEAFFALNRLILLGRPSEVVTFLSGQGGASVGAYERESLKLDAYAALGWHDLEGREIEVLLERGPSQASVTLVSSHLVRYPSAQVAASFFGLLSAKPLGATTDNAGAHMALLCAAGVNGQDAPMRAEADALARIVGGSFSAWGRVRDFFQGGSAGNPAVFLPALAQMPLEMVYALHEHYHAAHAGAPAPAQGGDAGGA